MPVCTEMSEACACGEEGGGGGEGYFLTWNFQNDDIFLLTILIQRKCIKGQQLW